jgi:hypothetical protein
MTEGESERRKVRKSGSLDAVVVEVLTSVQSCSCSTKGTKERTKNSKNY